jgi:hypothetical protein
MARYHGKRSRLYVSTTGTGNAVAVSGLTEWSIDMSTDRVDLTGMGDTNKIKGQGLPEIKGSFSGHWDDTDSTLFTARSSTDGCKIYAYPSLDKTSVYAYGPAWLDLSLKTGVTGGVDFSGSFEANGNWGFQGF